MISIQEFCGRHDACDEGCDWALENCDSMQDAWDKLKPKWLIWVATRPGVLTDRELRLFACWSVRQVWHLLTDERSRNAVEVAERFAEGNASKEELNTAAEAAARAARAAWVATRAAGYAVPSVAAGAWAVGAAEAAAWEEAEDASREAVRAATWASGAAAWEEAMEAQADWLRQNTKPNFEVENG